MKLAIRTRPLDLPAETRSQLRRRAWFALGRLAPAIRTVDLTLTTQEGPRGGAELACRVRVRGPEVGTIVVEHIGSDPLTTVGLAAERAERTVRRTLARRRGFAMPLSG